MGIEVTAGDFIGPEQLQVIRNAPVRVFSQKLAEIQRTLEAMPLTYQTEGQGLDAVARLHYFTPSTDHYIVELDASAEDGKHWQAFGLADLFQDGGELGYIAIPELLDAGAELDLWWTPRTLRDIRAKGGAA